jgi:hypothetical protein
MHRDLLNRSASHLNLQFRVVGRSFAWTTRSRRLVRDYERLPEALAGLHLLAFAILMLKRVVTLLVHSA